MPEWCQPTVGRELVDMLDLPTAGRLEIWCPFIPQIAMFVVYALKSMTRKYIYVGITSDIDRRLHEHNSGYEKTTKPYSPFSLLYTQLLETRVEAREREKYLKSGQGKDFLKSL